MSRARDAALQGAPRPHVSSMPPPRRNSYPASNLPTDIKELRHKCSWCGTFRERGELVQRRASLVCKGDCQGAT